MKKKKIYISGPISGRDIKEVEYQFGRIESILFVQGCKPVNPLKMWGCMNWLFRRLPYSLQMLIDICKLHGCDAILLMPDFECSRGARLEAAFAEFWYKQNVTKDYCKYFNM